MRKPWLVRKSLVYWALGLVAAGLGVRLLVRQDDTSRVHEELTEKDLYAARLKLQGSTTVTQEVAAPLDPRRPVRLAIGTLGLREAEEDRKLGDLVLAQLSGAGGFDLVDRQSLDKVLRELQLSFAGLVRAKDAVRVGKLLRADWFLLGTTAAVNGTNAIITRVVDGHTGIMRDIAVFPAAREGSALAAGLAEFVRQCRSAPAERPTRIYLALGTFEDLSLNARQQDFPARLRAYLTTAYQGSKVTLLERELAGELLHEVRLDLAGLTDPASGGEPVRMQSAFWLVNGYFQSYETTNMEVELNLVIEHFSGGAKRASFREPAGEALFQKVKAAIDKDLVEARFAFAPTRRQEIKVQLELAEELSRFGAGELTWSGWWDTLDWREERRERRNREEAVRALETVLLLDPSNREAKTYLGTFLLHFPFDRADEARNYYREVIESPMEDRWSKLARQGLLDSFSDRNRMGLAAWLQVAPGHAKWFETAASQTTNAAAGAFYREHAEAIKADLLVNDHRNPASQDLAAQRLLAEIQAWEKQLRAGQNEDVFEMPGIYNFARGRTNTASALLLLLPRLREQTPSLAPHLLAAVLARQPDTNNLAFAPFLEALERYTAQPETFFSPRSFSALLGNGMLMWAATRTNYGLSLKLLQARERAAAKGLATNPQYEHSMNLAFAYAGTDHWQQGLDLFLTYSNRPIYMGDVGLWGPAGTVVVTSHEIARCRRKLGLPAEPDPREFTLGGSCLCLHGPGEYHLGLGWGGGFAADSTGVWLAGADRLVQLSFGLETNLVALFPAGVGTGGTCVCPTPETVWVGTAAEGLLAFDRATQQVRRYTVEDGLMMDSLCSLCATAGEVWIGYGQGRSGGLGRMDLRTHRVTSFARSINGQPRAEQLLVPQGGLVRSSDLSHEPPAQPVSALAVGPSGEVWMVTRDGLRRFRPADNVWDAFPQAGACRAIAFRGDLLLAAQRPDSFGFNGGSVGGVQLELLSFQDKIQAGLGLSALNLPAGRWTNPPAAAGLPRANGTAVTVAGDQVWLGGLGYIALLAPETGVVRKLAYVPSRSVDRIDVAGGYVWVQADQHLFRAPVPAMN